jgi:4-amino-4-deoxy-L-arabinose transferase-like glycosyltransferase
MPNRYYSRSEHLRALWPWLPLWTVLVLLAIFAHGPMPLYSTRTLGVAWDMWNGHHWIVPYINGAPYSHKVPLLFWLIHAGWFAFGVNDVWPRVLEVIFGGAQLVLVATLARRLFPDRPWVARATPWMLLALSYAFLFGLQIMYEVLLAVCVLSALLCLAPARHRVQPRWWLFGFWVGAGLLTKGPVMFVHVLFPWLLGPLWNDYARAHRGRWCGFGALALLGGFAMLLAWVWPAIHIGGEAYANELLFKQTSGRVVDAFAHAEPWWWYLPMLPVLLFPFSAWPRAWAALGALRRPLEPGLRFLLCWLLPVLLVFSLVSGKQLYYPLPEFGGAVMLLAIAIALLRERHPGLGGNGWLGTWPLSVGGFAFGAFLIALPELAGTGAFASHWFVDLARYSRFFGVVYILLGLLLLLRGRGEMRRLAVAGLVGTFAFNVLFTMALWQNYDMGPAARIVRPAVASGRALANVGLDNGQFRFVARMTAPTAILHSTQQVGQFAAAHPDGLVVTYPEQLNGADLRYALLVQPFRGDWLVLWAAPTLAAIEAGTSPPEPAQPTQLYPADYWRYRDVK